MCRRDLYCEKGMLFDYFYFKAKAKIITADNFRYRILTGAIGVCSTFTESYSVLKMSFNNQISVIAAVLQ